MAKQKRRLAAFKRAMEKQFAEINGSLDRIEEALSLRSVAR